MTRTTQSAWTCIWNTFSPFWSLSQARGETGPEGISPLQIYVERSNVQPLRDVLRVMEPGRFREKAIVVGQRGTGKSMDLAWLTHELAKTHLVLWIDAVEERAEVLQDPVDLFVAMALVVYEGARQSGYNPDPDLLGAFLSTCFETTVREQISEGQFKLRLEEALRGLADVVKKVSWGSALTTAQPAFFIPGSLAMNKHMILDWLELGIDEKDTTKYIKTSDPHVDMAAVRLTYLIRDIETRCNFPILIVIDGLDRVEVKRVKTLFQRGKDLARPDVRLILTAPLVLYTTPEFDQLQDFFPHVFHIPNVQIGYSDDSGRQFLHQIVQRRLEICELTPEQVFEQGTLEALINACGGNIRQLIQLTREAAFRSEVRGLEQISKASAQDAINRVRVGLVARLRGYMLEALKEFYQAPLKILPGGELGDILLRNKWILAYADESGLLQYDLNPLVQTYLEQTGVL